jgi:hypothetical protein
MTRVGVGVMGDRTTTKVYLVVTISSILPRFINPVGQCSFRDWSIADAYTTCLLPCLVIQRDKGVRVLPVSQTTISQSINRPAKDGNDGLTVANSCGIHYSRVAAQHGELLVAMSVAIEINLTTEKCVEPSDFFHYGCRTSTKLLSSSTNCV